MPLKRSLLLVVFCCLLLGSLAAQNAESIGRNVLYVGGGRQGLLYLKYERLLFFQAWTQTIANAGLGGVPGDHSPGYNEPRHTIFTLEAAQLFGYKFLFLELGIEPAMNIHGRNTYIDLNGILGLRFQTWKPEGVFVQAGYNPRLYRTHESEVEVPVYVGLGLCF